MNKKVVGKFAQVERACSVVEVATGDEEQSVYRLTQTGRCQLVLRRAPGLRK